MKSPERTIQNASLNEGKVAVNFGNGNSYSIDLIDILKVGMSAYEKDIQLLASGSTLRIILPELRIDSEMLLAIADKKFLVDMKMKEADQEAVLLGRRISYLRANKGISKNKLSEAVGVSPGNINHIEKGTAYPSTKILLRILAVLQIKTEDFWKMELPDEEVGQDASE